MNKSLLTLIVITAFLLGVVGFVSAVPPQSDITSTNLDTGYQLFHPQYDYVPANTDFKLHVHVSNKSTGIPLSNNDVDCYIHIYSPTGSHEFESGAMGKDSNGWDHEITLDKANFSDLGIHAYFIWCNDTAFGGESFGVFEVTNYGKDLSIGFYIILLILSLLLIIIGYSVEDEWLIILGAFGFMLLGLFILRFGINNILDSNYTMAFGIITIFTGAYFAIRAGVSKLYS